MKNSFPFKIIDLSHEINPDMPLWPGDPHTKSGSAAEVAEDRYFNQTWQFGEHSGTHIGTPAHFSDGGRRMDSYDASELVYPAVKVKPFIHTDNLEKKDILLFEERNGKIPENSVVILNTGWDQRWHDPKKVYEKNSFGTFLYPGFRIDAVKWLLEERKIAGLATDAPGIDPGEGDEFKAGIMLAENGRFHLENLCNLDELPPLGAWLVIGALKLANGSGSPARVFGLIPKQ